MKKKLFYVLLLTAVGFEASAHPLHVSIVNVSMEDLALHITVNTYVDDWELAYFHYFGDTINLKSPQNHASEWFKSYLENSFSISEENEMSTLSLHLDTVCFKDMSMSIEMHAKLRGKPKSLYIYNAILTDIFADQTNLFIFSYYGEETGIKFDYKKKKEELNFR